MRFSRFALCAAVLTLTGFACEKKADTATEEAAIRAQVAAFNAAIVAKNDSAVAAVYADNATLMPPNEKAATGTAAIRASFAQMWPMNASLVVTPTSIVIATSGDMATEAGTWTFSATAPTGPMNDTGKYLVHWHKTNGEWKIAEDIWNSDNPPMAMAPSDSTTK